MNRNNNKFDVGTANPTTTTSSANTNITTNTNTHTAVAMLQKKTRTELTKSTTQNNNNNVWRKPLRRGKWTAEEEAYTERLIQDFSEGLLSDIDNGTTLRSWLAQKLDCCPMRISKKFVGESSIGKRMFERNEAKISNMSKEDIKNRENELNRLYKEFKTSWERDVADKQDAEENGGKRKRKRKKVPGVKRISTSKVTTMAKQSKLLSKKRIAQDKSLISANKRTKSNVLVEQPTPVPDLPLSLGNHFDFEAIASHSPYHDTCSTTSMPSNIDLGSADTQWLMDALPGLESCYDVLQDPNNFEMPLNHCFGKPKDVLSSIPSLEEVIGSPCSVLDIFSDAYAILFKSPTEIEGGLE